MAEYEPLEYNELYDYADLCARDGRHDEALAIYEKLYLEKPDNDSLLLSIAWVHIDMGNRQEALSRLEQLLEKELARNIFTGFAFDEMVKMYREIKEYDKLILLCERAVSIYPDDPALLSTLGDACLRSERWERALEVFTVLVQIDPTMSLYFMNRGLAALGAGSYEEAEAAVAEAIRLEPEDAAMIHDRLAAAFEGAGDIERALASRRKAIESDRSNPYYHCGLGDLYLAAGRLEDARSAYDEACRIIPSSTASLRNRLANQMLKAGLVSDAMTEFEKAIDADKDNPFYYISLIACCRATGDDERAQAVMKRGRSRGVLEDTEG